jgi:hypothetical protein
MSNWAHVENNQITGQYDLLPKSWRNISGLDLSKDNLPFLKSLGWYPVIQQNSPYDDVNYFIEKYDYVIQEETVLEVPILAEKVPQPVFEYSALKNFFIIELRKERNQKLIESDWTQLLDSQSLFDEEIKNKWIIYRQGLRDITNIYLQNDTIDISQVNWPQIPQK